MKKKILFSIIIVVFFMIFLVSCNNDGKIRKSKEENIKTVKMEKKVSSHGNMNRAPQKQAFEWDIPEGWENSKSNSRIRLATLIISDAKEDAECTIIPLGGDGGGFEPNVKLWLEQIGIKMELHGEDFKAFVKKRENLKTKSGLDFVNIDASSIVKNDTDKSVMVSIIKVGDQSVFIKLKGTKSVLVKNTEKFKAMSESFRLKK